MPSSSAIMAGAAYLKISLDSSQVTSGLEEVKSRFQKFAAGVRQWSTQMQFIGTMLALPIKGAISQFEAFDTRMRKVQAVTHATGAEFSRLSQHARKLGRDTSYTTQQVADAMLELGRMGFNTKEITDATESVMNLARATGSELALSANIASNMLRVFGKQASETSHFADVMVTVVNNSAQTLDDFAQAVSWSGPKFKLFGENFETMAASLGVLANMGIKGSLAGNSIGRGLVQLSDTKVVEYLRNMNIEVLDANGNLKPYLQNLREIAKAMSTMGSQQQMEMMKTIFGMRGMLGNIPLAVNMDAIDKMIEKIGNVDGAAADAMANIEGGIMGVLERMKSAFADMNIEFGSMLYDAFKGFIISATKAFKEITRLISEFKGALSSIVKIASVSFAISGIAKAFGILKYSISAVLAPLTAVQKAMNSLSLPDVAKQSAIASAKWAQYNYEKYSKEAFVANANQAKATALANSARQNTILANNAKTVALEENARKRTEIQQSAKQEEQKVRTASAQMRSFLDSEIKKNKDIVTSEIKKKEAANSIRAKIEKKKSSKSYIKLTSSAIRTEDQDNYIKEQNRLINNAKQAKKYNLEKAASLKKEILKSADVKKNTDFSKFNINSLTGLTREQYKQIFDNIDRERARLWQRLYGNNNYDRKIKAIRNTKITDRVKKKTITEKDILEFEAWKERQIASLKKSRQADIVAYKTVKASRRALHEFNPSIASARMYDDNIQKFQSDQNYISALEANKLTPKQQEELMQSSKQLGILKSSKALENALGADARIQEAQKNIADAENMVKEETVAREEKVSEIRKQRDASIEQTKIDDKAMVASAKEAKAQEEMADSAQREAAKKAARANKKEESARKEAEAQRQNVIDTYGANAMPGAGLKTLPKSTPFNDYVNALEEGNVAMTKSQQNAVALAEKIKRLHDFYARNVSALGGLKRGLADHNRVTLKSIAFTNKYSWAIMNMSFKDTAAAIAMISNSSRRKISIYAEAALVKVLAGSYIALNAVMQFLKANAITIGIMGITAAFAAMNNQLQKAIDKMKNLREQTSKQNEEQQNQRNKNKDRRERLLKMYSELEDNNLTEEYKDNVRKQIVKEDSSLGETKTDVTTLTTFDPKTGKLVSKRIENEYTELFAKTKKEFEDMVNDIYKKGNDAIDNEMAANTSLIAKALGKELQAKRNQIAGMSGTYVGQKIIKAITPGAMNRDEVNWQLNIANAFMKPLTDVLKMIDPRFSLTTGEFNFSATDFMKRDIAEQEGIVKRLKVNLGFLRKNETLVNELGDTFDSVSSLIDTLDQIVANQKESAQNTLDESKKNKYIDRQKIADDLKNKKAFNDAINEYSDKNNKYADNKKFSKLLERIYEMNPNEGSKYMNSEYQTAKTEYRKKLDEYEKTIFDASQKGYFDGTMPIDETEKMKQYLETLRIAVEEAADKFFTLDGEVDKMNKSLNEFNESQFKKYEERRYSKMSDQDKLAYDIGKGNYLSFIIDNIKKSIGFAKGMANMNSMNGNSQAYAQNVEQIQTLYGQLHKAKQDYQDAQFRIEDSRDAMLKNRQSDVVGSYSAKSLNRALSGDNYQMKSYQEAQKIRDMVTSIAGSLKLNAQQVGQILNKWGVAY